MSSTIVHQRDEFCSSLGGESSLSNGSGNENYSPANDDGNHLQTDDEKERNVSRKTRRGQLPFMCWVCLKDFSSTATLKVHELSHSAPYVCGVCSMEFPEVRNLKVHGTIHMREKKLSVCDECGKTFSTASYLKLHLPVHSAEKPYECALCHRGFAQMHFLKRHCQRHRVVPVDASDFRRETLNQSRRSNVRPKNPNPQPRMPRKAEKPCFWDNLRKGFSRNYLKDRRQALEKKSNFIKIEVD